MRNKLLAEIENMQQQAKLHLDLHQQALGAVSALQWALAQCPEEAMTEQQFIEAIERGQDDQ